MNCTRASRLTQTETLKEESGKEQVLLEKAGTSAKKPGPRLRAGVDSQHTMHCKYRDRHNTRRTDTKRCRAGCTRESAG